jgi:hypothetical protein
MTLRDKALAVGLDYCRINSGEVTPKEFECLLLHHRDRFSNLACVGAIHICTGRLETIGNPDKKVRRRAILAASGHKLRTFGYQVSCWKSAKLAEVRLADLIYEDRKKIRIWRRGQAGLDPTWRVPEHSL